MSISRSLTQQQSSGVAKTRWRRMLRGFLLYVVTPYVAVMLIMAVFQRRLMYHPYSIASLSATAVGLAEQPIDDAQIQTEDGLTLRGWRLRSAHDGQPGSQGLVIYFPGNAANRFDRLPDLQEIVSYGFDVLIFDYRGYGDSEGTPAEDHLAGDAQLVWTFATETLGYRPSKIVLFGESLGGAVALSLWSGDSSSHPLPAAVVLNSTFTSMGDTAAWHYPVFPIRWLLLDQWPSIERIPFVKCEITIFHGTDDRIVPVDQGRALAAATPRATLIEIPGGGHNGIPMQKLQRELNRIRTEFDRPRQTQ